MSVSVSFVRFLKLSMIYENIIHYDPKNLLTEKFQRLLQKLHKEDKFYKKTY